MKYDMTLFGEGIKVYSNGGSSSNTPLYDFTIPSQNANLSAAFKSGALSNNAPLPDNIFYWMIGKESPYNHFSCLFRSGSSPNYTYTKKDTEKNNKSIPIVLWAGMTKINSDYDIDVYNGAYTLNYGQNQYLQFNQSNFKSVNNSSPLWERAVDVPTTTSNPNGFYATYPFILDFDYNSFIYTIKVGYGSTFVDLADYVNTSSNYISIIGAQLNTGDVTTGYSRVQGQQRYDITGTPIMYASISPTVCCYRFVTDFDYNAPTWLRDLGFYDYDKFRKIAVTQNNNNYVLFNGTNVSSNENNSTPSYYMDDDKWEFDNGIYKLKKHGDGIYNDDDYNYIRKLIAWLGFWFTDGGTYTDSEHSYSIRRANSRLGDDANTYSNEYMIPDKIYQAEIKDGITTGNFTELRIAKDNEQSKWGKDWREKNGYEGRDKISPTDESSKSSKTMYESTFASFGRIYKCFPPSAMYPSGTIQSLADQLRTYIFSGNYDGSLFYNQNPVDCITSIKEYPFDISDYIETLGTELIQLGRWRVQTSDRPELYCPFVRIKSSSTPIFYGSLSIPSSFKTIGYEFLDYEPYSKYDLYLPFCGTINIPSALAVETLIEVLYFIDLLSGCCIAHIYIDNKYYCSAQGQVAVEIPVSGYQIGNYTRDMLNATYAQKQAYANVASDVGRLITSIGGSAIGMGINSKVGYGGSNPITIPDPINPAMALFSGTAGGLVNAGQIISGAGKAIQAGAAMASHYETIKYNKSILSHSAPAPIKSSLGGGIINWESPYYVEMLVQRPIFMADYDEETYKATLGKACHIADTLANHSGGYVEAINCNLSGFPATQPEKVELAKLLADGVFL